MNKHVVILNVVGLAPHHRAHMPSLASFAWRPMRPSFPAVTCSVQATLLTGLPPSEHGIIANGYFDRDAFEVKFWEQPAALVQRPRLWDMLPNCKTAVLFWQNSMFINADIVVTPRPLHLDHKFVQWCYSKPAGYYEELKPAIGDFKLQSYWGPLAGIASSRWIARAAQVTWRKHRPNLMLVYLPHLDYASQRLGPEVPAALREIDEVVGELVAEFAKDATVIVCSEYSLAPVDGVMYPNRLLRAAGLLRVREIAGQEFLDFELSDAFAMVDHQVAHIYCKPGATGKARAALGNVEFTTIHHPRAGELVAIAPAGQWFSYYWWNDWQKAPAFAHSIDIHRKPGYDPCELWFDWPRTIRNFHPATSIKPDLVKGSHGRVNADHNSWATLALDERADRVAALTDTASATDLAPLVCRLLDG
jgi:predicted AlkP superfamily pyrophosphatase or phosphodiesterase